MAIIASHAARRIVPADLINPVSALSGKPPSPPKETEHFFFQLDKFERDAAREWTRAQTACNPL